MSTQHIIESKPSAHDSSTSDSNLMRALKVDVHLRNETVHQSRANLL